MFGIYMEYICPHGTPKFITTFQFEVVIILILNSFPQRSPVQPTWTQKATSCCYFRKTCEISLKTVSLNPNVWALGRVLAKVSDGCMNSWKWLTFLYFHYFFNNWNYINPILLQLYDWRFISKVPILEWNVQRNNRKQFNSLRPSDAIWRQGFC